MIARDYLCVYESYRKDFKDKWNIEPEITSCLNNNGQLELVMCHPKDKNRKISSFRYGYASL